MWESWQDPSSHLRQSVRPETERRMAIRQTVPTMTSTMIKQKVVFVMNFHFELVYRSTRVYSSSESAGGGLFET